MIRVLYFFLFLAAAGARGESLTELSSSIDARERMVVGLKEGNQAHIDFYRSATRTQYSFLYLHGFSASPRESSPLVENLARVFKANSYFPRFKGHGLHGGDGLAGVSTEEWEREAQASYDVASLLGEKVVIVAMSTGASLALTALGDRPVHAFLLISPNFRLHRWDSVFLRIPLIGPWIARIVLGEYYQWQPHNREQGRFWNTKYPSAAAVLPVRAAAKANQADLSLIESPALFAYTPKDDVIDVPSLLEAFSRMGSHKKALLAMPEAEDSHVIAGEILSPKNSTLLESRIEEFLLSLPLPRPRGH